MQTLLKAGSKFPRNFIVVFNSLTLFFFSSSMDNIIKAGKEHGVRTEDIFGCFYFFLSQELRTFAQRLRAFRISFKVHTMDACDLSRIIRADKLSGSGLSKSIRFDRVEVSNILDTEYVGTRDVLVHWGPLLADTNTAAIVGYFMNWTRIQRDGSPAGAGKNVTQTLLEQLKKKKLKVTSQI
jgi:hypothetical protein